MQYWGKSPITALTSPCGVSKNMKYVNEYYNNKYTIINKTNKKCNIVCNHMCSVHIRYGGVVASSQSKAWCAPFSRCLCPTIKRKHFIF